MSKLANHEIHGISRRGFLKSLSVGAGLLVAPKVLTPKAIFAPAQAQEHIDIDETQTALQPEVDTSVSQSPYHSATDTQAVTSRSRLAIHVNERKPLMPIVAQSSLPDVIEKNAADFLSFPSWYENLGDEEQSMGASLRQDLFVTLGSVVVGSVLKQVGVPVGNGGLKELLQNEDKLRKLNLPSLLTSNVVVAPILEELIFRAAPSAILNTVSKGNNNYDKRSSALPLALGTSTLFAAVHNIGAKEAILPLPQFALGMLNWRLARHKGVGHVMALHALHNGIAIGAFLPTIHSKKQQAIRNYESKSRNGASSLTPEQKEMISKIVRDMLGN